MRVPVRPWENSTTGQRPGMAIASWWASAERTSTPGMIV